MNRYDPRTGRFAAFRHNPADPHSLSHDAVYSLMVDHQGNVWAGTGDGFSRLEDPATGRFRSWKAGPPGTSPQEVSAVTEDPKGVLWFQGQTLCAAVIGVSDTPQNIEDTWNRFWEEAPHHNRPPLGWRVRGAGAGQIAPSGRPAAAVLLENSKLHENMGVTSPPSIPPLGAQRPSRAGLRRVGGLPSSSRTPSGQPRPPASARRPAPLGEATESDAADRLLWTWLPAVWSDWPSALLIVKLETVIAWHRKGFRLLGTGKTRRGEPGRPSMFKDIRELLRKMSRENALWGAPRIHGELLKLGIDIGETSVSKYMSRVRKPRPSGPVENHVQNTVSVDLFTVPTIRFQILYVIPVLAHHRRRIAHANVTAHPTAEWVTQQLREAFPFSEAPKYLLRDQDGIF